MNVVKMHKLEFLSDSDLDAESVHFVDNSLLFNSYAICREKGRLSSLHYRPSRGIPALDYGGAIHAGVASLATNKWDLNGAKLAFLKYLREQDSTLPISIMDIEKRSVERGLNILSGYQTRWANDIYETIFWGPDNKPLVEVPFRLYLFDWNGKPVILTGVIDKVGRNTNTDKVNNVETKTTSKSLSVHSQEVRPNHQVTTYIFAIREWLGLDIDTTVWDAIFISDRKPSEKGDSWTRLGVDIEKDYRRTETTRNKLDISDWYSDVCEMARDYLTWKDKNLERWPRTGNVMACHVYGGCMFRDICYSNLDPVVLNSNYIVKKWEPWKTKED